MQNRNLPPLVPSRLSARTDWRWVQDGESERPIRFTLLDKYRIALGVIALLLGMVILSRTLAVAISPPAILIGLAFIGLGVHRLWLGYTRVKQWKGQT